MTATMKMWVWRLARALILGGLLGGGLIWGVKVWRASQPPQPSARSVLPARNPSLDRPVASLPKLDPGLLAPAQTQTSAAGAKRVSIVVTQPDGTPAPFKALQTLRGGQTPRQIAFSADGRWLISGDYGDHSIRVWSVATGTLISTRRNSDRITSLALASDQRTIVTGDAYRHVTFWPLSADGQVGAGTRVEPELGSHAMVAISPNDRVVAVTSFEAKQVVLLDAQTRAELGRVDVDLPLRKPAFWPDGRRLLVATNTNVLIEFDLATGAGRKLALPPIDADTDCTGIAFSPDGRRLSTGHNQPYVTVWDVAAGPELPTYRHYVRCPLASVTDVAFSPDSEFMVFALYNARAFVWRPDVPNVPVAEIATGSAAPCAIAVSTTGLIAIADESGAITIWGH